MNLIMVAGMPASGKTTIAGRLGKAFGYPILEKDAIKEELFDVLGFHSYSEKRLIDDAATSVLIRCTDALLQGGGSVIVVNNFRPEAAPRIESMLEKYRCGCVLVFLGGTGDIFYRRYVERDDPPKRHLGHVLQDHYPPLPGESPSHNMTREEFAEKFEKLGMNEFQLKGVKRIDVDATYPERIDTDGLIKQVRQLLREKSGI